MLGANKLRSKLYYFVSRSHKVTGAAKRAKVSVVKCLTKSAFAALFLRLSEMHFPKSGTAKNIVINQRLCPAEPENMLWPYRVFPYKY